MKYTIKHDPARFERLAQNVWGLKDGMEAIEKLKSFWHACGLPVTFKELGGKESDIAYLAKNIPYINGKLGCFVPLKEADVVAIYGLMV